MRTVIQKTVSLLLVLVTLAALLPAMPVEADADSGVYIAEKAIAFAKDPSQHMRWTEVMCANYVTHCLEQGIEGFKGNIRSTDLFKSLKNQPYVREVWKLTKENLKTKSIRPGDVLFVCRSKTQIYPHVIFIVDVNDNTVVYCGNNTFRHMKETTIGDLLKYHEDVKFGGADCSVIVSMKRCEHNYTNSAKGVCTLCGYQFDYLATRARLTGMIRANGGSVWVMDTPYSKGAGGVNLYRSDGKPYQEDLAVTGRVKNAYGNTWYEVTLDDGRVGYVYPTGEPVTYEGFLEFTNLILPRTFYKSGSSTTLAVKNTTVKSNSSSHKITSVSFRILRVETNGAETTLYDYSATGLNTASYSLPKAGDSAMGFSGLKNAPGSYIYQIVVNADPGANASAATKRACRLVIRNSFVVAKFTGCNDYCYKKNSQILTLYRNDGTGALKYMLVTCGNKVTLPTEANREGHTFLGWADSPNATAATKKAGASVSVTGGQSLYAVWQKKADSTAPAPNQYTVSFDANGGTNAPAAQNKTQGKSLTLSKTAPTRTGYTFLGWGETRDAAKVAYKAGAKYSKDANITLYALWQANTYKVKFNANGGKGKVGDLSCTYDQEATLPKNAFTREGYTFNGWNDKADGSGSGYADGHAVKNLTATSKGTVTLYAQWALIKTAEKEQTVTISGTATTKNPDSYTPAKTFADVEAIVNDYYATVTQKGSAYWNAGIRRELTGSDSTKALKSMPFLNTVTNTGCTKPHAFNKGNGGCFSNGFNGVGVVNSSKSAKDAEFKSNTDYQCSGFAAYMAYVVFKDGTGDYVKCYGTGKNSLDSKAGGQIKAGDVLRYPIYKNGVQTSAHSVFIYKVEGDKAYVIECNWNGNCSITMGRTMSLATIKDYLKNSDGKKIALFSSPAKKTSTVQVTVSDDFLRSCTEYPTYLSLRMNKPDIYLYTLPWSESAKLHKLEDQEHITAVGLYLNVWGNYWYLVRTDDNITGYVYGGHTSLEDEVPQGAARLTVSLDTTTPQKGKSNNILGSASSDYLKLTQLMATLTDSQENVYTETETDLSKAGNLKNTRLNKLKFGKLSRGTGKLTVLAEFQLHYTPNGTTRQVGVLSLTEEVDFTVVETYKVSFDANGGKNPPGKLDKTVDQELTLPTACPTRAGYIFLGWSMLKDGDTAEFEPGGKLTVDTLSGEMKLYAVWTPVRYTVTYDANGGTNVPEEDFKYQDQEMAVTQHQPVREGYTFLGWAEKADAQKPAYKPGGAFKGNQDTTLYAVWEANPYYVSYHANGGTGTMKDSRFAVDKPGALSANKFKKPGYAFLGWNLQMDGSGTGYADGEQILNLTTGYNHTVTLYAQWMRLSDITYTLTFDANGGSNAPAAQEKRHDEDAELTWEQPEREGYTFQGWAEKANAQKPAYKPGGAFKRNRDTTLYAVWKANRYTVTYDANGGKGRVADTKATVDKPSALMRCTYRLEGYAFAGWNRNPDGSGESFRELQEVENLTLEPGGVVTLYAQWVPLSDILYTITYDANGGENGPGRQEKYHGEAVTLSLAEPTRQGYSFLGWATEPGSKSVRYTPGKEYRKDQDLTLYAVWKANPYTITYDANGGTGSMGKTKATVDKDVVLLKNKFKRADYVFAGWNRNPDGTGEAFADRQSVCNLTLEPNGIVTLYAQWERVGVQTYTVSYDANGGSYAPAPQVKEEGEPLLLTEELPLWEGHTFLGWAMDPNSTKTDYLPGGSYNLDADVILFAVWEEESAVRVADLNADPHRYWQIVEDVVHDDLAVEVDPFDTDRLCQVTVEIVPSERIRAKYSNIAYWYGAEVDALVTKEGIPMTNRDLFYTFAITAGEHLFLVHNSEFLLDIRQDTQLQIYAHEFLLDYNGGLYNGEEGVAGSTNFFFECDKPVIQTCWDHDALTREGYTLAGWSQDPNAAEPAYSPEIGQAFYTDTTLYAVWKPQVEETGDYCISYESYLPAENMPEDQWKEHGRDLILSDWVPTSTLGEFLYWETNVNGEILTFLPGDAFMLDTDAALWAVWEKAPTYLYDANGEKYWQIQDDVAQEVEPFDLTGLSHITITVDPSESIRQAYDPITQWRPAWGDGYRLTEAWVEVLLQDLKLDFYITPLAEEVWLTTPNLDVDQRFMFDEDRDLVFDIYTLTYEGQGGTIDGDTDQQVYTYEYCPTYRPRGISLLHLQKEGYTFLGWSTDPEATEAEYMWWEETDFSGDVTLYAVWQEKPQENAQYLVDNNTEPQTYWKIYGETMEQVEPYSVEDLAHVRITMSLSEGIREAWPEEQDAWNAIFPNGKMYLNYTTLNWKDGTFDFYASRGDGFLHHPYLRGPDILNIQQDRELTWPICQIRLDCNGGTGYSLGEGTVEECVGYFVAECGLAEAFLYDMAREGYRFLGWSEDPNATEAEHGEFVYLDFETDTVLYAVWEAE